MRAQTLRQQLVKGLIAARERLYKQRKATASQIRRESQARIKAIIEMKEREMNWRRRLRARVLGQKNNAVARNFQTEHKHDFQQMKRPASKEDALYEETHLRELQNELELAMKEEHSLNEELLELQVNYICGAKLDSTSVSIRNESEQSNPNKHTPSVLSFMFMLSSLGTSGMS